MSEFKEVVLTPEAALAWAASPTVTARATQLKAFAEHQQLRFDAEGLTRMLQFNNTLNQTQGHLPVAHEFMPGRKFAV